MKVDPDPHERRRKIKAPANGAVVFNNFDDGSDMKSPFLSTTEFAC
jgi:hypothetical protein